MNDGAILEDELTTDLTFIVQSWLSRRTVASSHGLLYCCFYFSVINYRIVVERGDILVNALQVYTPVNNFFIWCVILGVALLLDVALPEIR